MTLELIHKESSFLHLPELNLWLTIIYVIVIAHFEPDQIFPLFETQQSKLVASWMWLTVILYWRLLSIYQFARNDLLGMSGGILSQTGRSVGSVWSWLDDVHLWWIDFRVFVRELIWRFLPQKAWSDFRWTDGSIEYSRLEQIWSIYSCCFSKLNAQPLLLCSPLIS